MDWPATITALTGMLLAFGVVSTQMWNIRKDMRKSQAAMQETLTAVATNVETVHKATNSMKDELVAAVREAATLKGEKQGAQDEKLRASADKSAVDAKTPNGEEKL